MKYGPGTPDRSCTVCKGGGFEWRRNGTWTVCACRERSYRAVPPEEGIMDFPAMNAQSAGRTTLPVNRQPPQRPSHDR